MSEEFHTNQEKGCYLSSYNEKKKVSNAQSQPLFTLANHHWLDDLQQVGNYTMAHKHC